MHAVISSLVYMCKCLPYALELEHILYLKKYCKSLTALTLRFLFTWCYPSGKLSLHSPFCSSKCYKYQFHKISNQFKCAFQPQSNWHGFQHVSGFREELMLFRFWCICFDNVQCVFCVFVFLFCFHGKACCTGSLLFFWLTRHFFCW